MRSRTHLVFLHWMHPCTPSCLIQSQYWLQGKTPVLTGNGINYYGGPVMNANAGIVVSRPSSLCMQWPCTFPWSSSKILSSKLSS